MPLLNIDLPRLSTDILPDDARESFDALPVRARLVGVATFAHIGGDTAVRDAALRALAVMDAPAYVGLSALRTTLQVCNSLVRIPVDRCDFLAAASTTTDPQREGYALTAKWPRRLEDRWTLAITGRDVAEAVSAINERPR
jgi:hypothetical protein